MLVLTVVAVPAGSVGELFEGEGHVVISAGTNTPGTGGL